MLIYPVDLVIEPKEEAAEGISTDAPSTNELIGYLNDLLNDRTKHDERIGWRITRVSEAN